MERADRADLHAPPVHRGVLAANLEPLRDAIRARRRVRFAYTDKDGELSLRTVRPLGLYFWGTSWTLTGWCELRADFRTFRTARIRDLAEVDVFEDEPGKDLTTFMRRIAEREDWTP